MSNEGMVINDVDLAMFFYHDKKQRFYGNINGCIFSEISHSAAFFAEGYTSVYDSCNLLLDDYDSMILGVPFLEK